jgi:hypothetical protein
VKQQQLEQLQRREEQLRGEARELGFLEEQPEETEVDVDEKDEDVAMAGDVVDRRRGGRRQQTRPEESINNRYTGSSLYDDRRRSALRRVDNESDRGNYYPDQANEYYENEEDDGTAGELEDEVPRQRAPQRQRQSSRYASTNIYREAAKRKQQRRRDQEM